MNREAVHCIPQNVHYLNRREFLRPNIPFHPSKCRREAIIFVFFEDLGQKGKFSNTRMISVSEFLSISLLFPPLLPLSLQNIGRDFRHRVLDLIIISEWLLLDRKTAPKSHIWAMRISTSTHLDVIILFHLCYHSCPSADPMTLGKPKRPLCSSSFLDLRAPQSLFSVPSCPLEIIAYASVPILYMFQPVLQTLTVWD